MTEKEENNLNNVKGKTLMLGFKWLCHLSLHCFPILPGNI